MSRSNHNRVRAPVLGEDVVSTALHLMCDHGLQRHTIQLVVYLDANKFYVSEFRCAVCTNRLPFLLVSSARRSVALRDFLLANEVKVNIELKHDKPQS